MKTIHAMSFPHASGGNLKTVTLVKDSQPFSQRALTEYAVLAKCTFFFLFLSHQFAFSQINWQQTNGPYGATVYAFAMNSSNVYAGTFGGGVYTSTNNGATWAALNNGLSDFNVFSLVADGSNLVAGTTHGGVFLSTNNGTSWTNVSISMTDAPVQSLAVSGSTIYAGTDGNGLFKSTNNGTSWTAINNGLWGTRISSIIFKGSILFIVTDGGGVFSSIDNGNSWIHKNTGLSESFIITLATNGTALFAGGSNGAVYMTVDDGSSWTKLVYGSIAGNVYALAVNGSSIYAATSGAGVYVSTNNGASWTSLYNGLTDGYIHSLLVKGSTIFAGTDNGGGIYLSTNNGASWTAVNSGLIGPDVLSLITDGSNLYAGTNGVGGVFVSTNNGTNWRAINNGLASTRVMSLALNGSNLYAATNAPGIYVSTNNGSSWTAINNGLPSSPVMKVVSDGLNLYAGTNTEGAYLSTNNGAIWTAINNGLTNLAVKDILLNGTNLFAATDGGVFLSTNNGTSWTSVNNGLSYAYATSLVNNGANIFAGISGVGVFLSTNNGANWTAVNTGLTNKFINTFTVSGTNILAGTDGGVFLSTNNGTSWSAFNSGISNNSVTALTVDGEHIYAGTRGRGVLVSDVPWPLVPNIASFTPTRNALNVGTNTTIGITFDQDINESTLTNSTVRINGSKSGLHAAVISYNATTKTSTLIPNKQFSPGELVVVTATRGIKSATGDSLRKSCSWSFTIKSNIASGAFTPASSPSVGNAPYAHTAGDWNNDGILDLAVANSNANSVSILINNGSGQYTQASSVGVGNNPRSIISGDWNGDLIQDLAVVNVASSTISILMNNGNGQFIQASTPGVGASPSSITSGDWNNDGYLDFAVANMGSATISIMMNNGSGQFTQTSTSGVGFNPQSVISGDWNGDGYFDLAVANFANNSVTLLVNNGSGIFTESSIVNVGTSPISVISGDWNNDGYQDLAAANKSSNTVSILINNGSGVFTQSSTPSVENLPVSVSSGDWNGDGYQDLAVANNTSNTVNILINNGSGAFTRTSSLSVGNSPMSVVSGDMNGDGLIDLAVTNAGSNTVTIMMNSASSSSTPAVTGNFYKIPKTKIAPVIDGKVDPVWDAVACTWQQYFNYGSHPANWADLSGWSKLMWDDRNLYGLFYTQDNVIDSVSGVDWAMDDVELYIDAGHSHTYSAGLTPPQYHFCFRPAQKVDSVQTAVGKGIKYRWMLDTASTKHNGPGSYFVEYCIPLDSVSISAIAGTQVSLEFQQNDNDGQGRIRLSKWANSTGLDDNWYQTLHWGDGILTDENQQNGQTVDSTFVFLKASVPPTIDGNLDAVWKSANQVTMCARRFNNGPATLPKDPQDQSWRFYGLYDDNNIYGFFQVNDDVADSEHGIVDWQMDGVLMLIDAGHTHTTVGPITPPKYQFSLRLPQNIDSVQNAIGHGLQYKWTKFTGNSNDSLFSSSLSGYNVEFKFSLAGLGINNTTGTAFSLQLAADDNDNDGTGLKHHTEWWNTSASYDFWQYTLHWGNAKLGTGVQVVAYPPSTPRNLLAQAGNGQVTLKWNKNTESDFLRYRIYRGTSPNPTIKIDSSSNSSLDTVKLFTGLANGTKYYFRISAVNTSGLESGYSNEVSVTPAAPLTITSFSPTSGPVGKTVTITGTNFDPSAANDIVYFGAVKAAVTTVTSTSLSVTVPTGATYQPITVTVNGLTACTNAPFDVTFPSSRIINTSSFASKIDFTSGNNPYGVAIGDFDGDGKPDLVATNFGGNTISVYRNTSTVGSFSNSSFAAKADFLSCLQPSSVALADVDGDGKLDIVLVSAQDQDSLAVLRNTSSSGNISFAPKVNFVIDGRSYCVAIRDLDGDGKPDIVAPNFPGNKICVFQNTSTIGSISFASKVDFASGSNPTTVGIGDLDGDGKPDLVTSNYGGGTVSAIRNISVTGSISSNSFAPRVELAATSSASCISIGDLDGDNKPDLAVSINTGTGVFQNVSTSGSISSNSFNPLVSIAPAGTLPVGALSDLDGDGKPDLIGCKSDSISVLRNNCNQGSITSSSFETRADFATGSYPYGIAIGDLDGDGKPDLVVANSHESTISVLQNTISDSPPPVVTGNSYKIPKTRIAPVIDGKVDPVWNAVACTWQENFNYGSFPTSWADLSGWSKLLWDDYNIYGLFYSQDNVVDTISTIDWQMDCIEFLIDAGHSHTTSSGLTPPQYQFCLRLGQKIDSVQTAYGHGLKYRWLLDTASIKRGGPSGYFVEFSIPLANLSIPAIAGTQVSLECQQGDNDNDGLGRIHHSKWANSTGIEDSWYQTLHWGDAILTDENQPNGQTADSQYVFLKTSVPPAIDGDLDAVWKQSNQLTMCSRNVEGGLYPADPQDQSWRFYGLYDNNYLYGFFQVNDDIVNIAPGIDWQMDGIVLYIDATNSHNTMPLDVPKYMFSLKPPQNVDSVQTAYGHGLQYKWKKFLGDGNSSVFSSSLSGYTVEFKLSLDSLSINPTLGTPFSFNLETHDNDGTGRKSVTNWWNPSGIFDYWYQTLHWGNARLGTGTITPVTEPPTIASFTPTSGPIGTTVTIRGQNFNTTVSDNIIYFGAVKAKVIAANSNMLTVTVPTGATYQPITVTDVSTGLTAVSNKPFIVTFPSSRIIDAKSFAPKVDFATGTNPVGIAAADLDSDGKSDMLCINSNSNNFSVFRNISSRDNITTESFGSKVNFNIGRYPINIATADIDGDGKQDLAITNGGNSVSIYRNKCASGSITSGSFSNQIDLTTGPGPDGIAIADLNGDGKLDVVVTDFNTGGNTISVLQNTSAGGSITFAPKVDFSTGIQPIGVAIADFDGDGKPDIAVTNYGSKTVSIFRNSCSTGSINSTSFADKIDFSVDSTPAGITIADFDGDDKPDFGIAIYGGAGNKISIFRNTCILGSINSGSFASKVDFNTGRSPSGIAVADLDGDGRPDVIVGNKSDNTVSVLHNMCISGNINSSSFASKVDFAVGVSAGQDLDFQLAVVDVDGDAKSDLLVVNQTSNTISILQNTIKSTSPNSFIARESFEYATGDTLGGLGGAIDGFAGAWKYDDGTPGFEVIGTIPLDYLNLTHHVPNVGNHLTAACYGNWGNTQYRRQLSSTWPNTAGATYWTSFIFQANGIPTDSSWYLFKLFSGNSELLAIGKLGNGTKFGAGSGWPSNVAPGEIKPDVSTLDCDRNPVWLVTETIMSGASLCRTFMWIDPDPTSTTLDTNLANVKRFTMMSSSFDNIVVECGGLDPIQINWDEIRLGTSWIDVSSPLTPSNYAPAKPQKPVAFAGDSKVLLTWKNNTENDLLMYRIYMGSDSITMPLKESLSIDPLSEAKSIIRNLANGTTYYFRITAIDSEGLESAYSIIVKATPSKLTSPMNILAEAVAESQINLSWSSGGGMDIRYRIYRSADSLSYTVIDSTITTSYSDTTLTQLTSYWYKLTAVNGMGEESGFSGTVKATTLRPMPRIMSLETPVTPQRGDVKMNYTLRIPAGVTANLACDYSTDGGISFTPTVNVIGGVTNIATSISELMVWKTGLDLANFESRSVKFRLTPSDQTGAGIPVSTNIFSVDNKPPVFAGVTAAGWDTNKIRLRWMPAADLMTPISYNVYRSTSSGTQNYTTPEAIVTDTNAVIRNLPALEKEYFVVRAMDAAGNFESNTVERSIRVSPLSDFTGDMKVDGSDLAILAWAWWNKNISVADIGPAMGTPPYFDCRKDNKIDLEDLMIFAQMWDWSVDQPLSVSQKLAKGGETGNCINKTESLTLRPRSSVTVNMTQAEMSASHTIEYIVSVNGKKVQIDSIYSLSSDVATVLTNINSARGLGFVVLTDLHNSDARVGTKEYVVSLTALTTLFKDTIRIQINGFDENAKLKYQSERVIVMNPEPLLPETFALRQNYPNPFNPSTTIEYDLPEPAKVTLKVFNMLGQEIAKFVDGEVSAGYQKTVWNATVSSGVYFYRFEAESLTEPGKRFSDVKKMVLMR